MCINTNKKTVGKKFGLNEIVMNAKNPKVKFTKLLWRDFLARRQVTFTKLLCGDFPARQKGRFTKSICGDFPARKNTVLSSILDEPDIDKVVASSSAKKWVGGEHGLISFTECCDALDLDTRKAKKAMREFADVEKRKPISRVVFGVKVKDG